MANEFTRWGRWPDEEIDLADAALAIARDEYPSLDAGAYRERLDAMAGQARAGLEPHAGATEILAALDHRLFATEGFAGNESDYYDPRNSYLNDVLDRRVGIPITLSIVYLEVGRGMGLALDPVSFPGHFLVRSTENDEESFIDPFHRGRRLAPEELLARLIPVLGDEAAASAYLPRALAPVPRRAVVARLLRNLKGIHAGAEDWARALRVTDRLVAVTPEIASEIRDRGHFYARLEAYAAALEDYKRYLALTPGAEDATEVRELMESLRHLASPLN